MLETEVDWDEYRSLVPKGVDPDRDSKAWRIREDIIVSHLYLTKNVVSKMIKTMPAHVERDDLESWAKIGLMRAVMRFDHTMNVPFAAFAAQNMRSCILDGIREQDWAPRSLRKKQRDIKKAKESLRQEMGREPTQQDVAERLEINVQDVETTNYKVQAANHVRIEDHYSSIAEMTTPDTDDIVSQLRRALALSFIKLPVRDAVVIALYYYEKLNLAEIAKVIGVSGVKCGQIHNRAVLALWSDIEKLLEE